MYNLIPEDNYTVPAEAEGLDAQKGDENESKDGRRLTILRKEDDTSGPTPLFDDMDAPGATTRRHKHTPSTGSRVTTIAENAEDTDDNQKPPLPEVKEDPGRKEAEEMPVKETGEPVDTPLVSMTTEEAGEGQEEAQELPESERQISESRQAESEPSESQSSETQPPETQPLESQRSETEKSDTQPEPQSPDEKEQKPSEAPVSEPGPDVTSENAPADEQEQAQPTKAEEQKEDTQSSQESEAEKTTTEETAVKSPEPEPESKPTETKVEAETPKET